MRWNLLFPIVAALVTLSFAGCVSDEKGKSEAKEDPKTTGGTTSAPPGTPASGRAEITAPTPRPGLLLTYRLDGPWALQKRANVVIAEKDNRIVMAGATRDDLTREILEGTFLFGKRSADMNEVDDSGKEIARVLDFPLWDGKAWTSGDMSLSADFEMKNSITSPVTITGEEGDLVRTYVYDPAIGYLSAYKESHKERGALWSATYEGTDFADKWVWYEYDGYGAAGWGDGDKVGTATVSAAANTVYYESYGDFNTRAVGLSPSGKYEPFEGFGPARPVTRAVAAEAGEWRLATFAGPDQAQTLWLVAVKWVLPAG